MSFVESFAYLNHPSSVIDRLVLAYILELFLALISCISVSLCTKLCLFPLFCRSLTILIAGAKTGPKRRRKQQFGEKLASDCDQHYSLIAIT